MTERLAAWAADIDIALERITNVPGVPGAPERLIEAMRYSLLSGGKRLRGALLLAACETFGGAKDEAMTFACAIECIHCFSLIHDDMPAMDNDDTRRGKPSNHIVFGEGMALLAGDALLAFAAERMLFAAWSHAGDAPRVDRYVKAAHAIMHASGVGGIAGGQCMDLEGPDHPQWRDGDFQTRAERLMLTHQRKTGALFKASAYAGAIIAGADEADASIASHFGKTLGLAFQIRDDILDVEGDPDKMGKRAGMDAGKCAWPSLHGITKSKETADALERGALDILTPLGDKGALLAGFVETTRR